MTIGNLFSRAASAVQGGIYRTPQQLADAMGRMFGSQETIELDGPIECCAPSTNEPAFRVTTPGATRSVFEAWTPSTLETSQLGSGGVRIMWPNDTYEPRLNFPVIDDTGADIGLLEEPAATGYIDLAEWDGAAPQVVVPDRVGADPVPIRELLDDDWPEPALPDQDPGSGGAMHVVELTREGLVKDGTLVLPVDAAFSTQWDVSTGSGETESIPPFTLQRVFQLTATLVPGSSAAAVQMRGDPGETTYSTHGAYTLYATHWPSPVYASHYVVAHYHQPTRRWEVTTFLGGNMVRVALTSSLTSSGTATGTLEYWNGSAWASVSPTVTITGIRAAIPFSGTVASGKKAWLTYHAGVPFAIAAEC